MSGMLQRLGFAVLAALVAGLGLLLFEQSRRIERLGAEVEGLRAALDERQPGAALPRSGADGAPHAARAPAAPDIAPRAAAAPAQPRAPVSSLEIARVESAMLNLLESDRPELREKLRAVVQAEQQRIEKERRDQRREFWISRREARLAELGQSVGITAEQRQAILTAILASRDQIEDMVQSAQKAEETAAARDKAREVREQTEAQIRGLLSADQYKAYQSAFAEEDRPFGRQGMRMGPPPP